MKKQPSRLSCFHGDFGDVHRMQNIHHQFGTYDYLWVQRNRSSGEISLAAPSLGKELHSDERFAGTRVGVASRCDEPAWGRECLQKFMVQVGKWRMVGLRWMDL